MEDPWSDPRYVRTRTRRKTIWLLGIVAHVGLFASLVVWPYFRGDLRSRDARLGFGEFAACFYGGSVTGETGLALPRGDRLAYASQCLGDDSSWPSRCSPLLDEIVVGEPLILYPGIKTAEEGVRRAGREVAEELVVLEAARSTGGGRVPTAPVEAIGRLAGALAELAREVDPMTRISDEVIRLETVGLPKPALIPLTTAADAVIRIEARADGILARAVDTRGLSRTRVAGGRSRYLRIRRPPAVRALVDAPGFAEPWLVSTTAGSVCAEDPERCAHRSTGLSRWVAGRGIEETRWYAGHPAGRIDRVVTGSNGEVVIAAVALAGGGAEVRRFDRPTDLASADATETGPGEAHGGPSEGGAGDASSAFVPVDGERPSVVTPASIAHLPGMTTTDDVVVASGEVVYTASDEVAGVRLFRQMLDAPDTPAAVEVTRLDGSEPFVFVCGSGRYLVFGTDVATTVIEVASSGGVVRHRAGPLGLAAVDPRHPSRDRVRVSCDESGASVALDRGGDEVSILSCAPGADCEALPSLGPARAFDMVRVDGNTVVAWLRDEEEGAIRVRTDGPTPIPARIVAACFSDDEGLCGRPRLSARNGRLILAAQQGRDLRVLESRDAGHSFEAMRGIR